MGVGGLAQLLSGMWEVSFGGGMGNERRVRVTASLSHRLRLTASLLSFSSLHVGIPSERPLSARQSQSPDYVRKAHRRTDSETRPSFPQLRNVLDLLWTHLLAELWLVNRQMLQLYSPLTNPALLFYTGILTADYAEGELESALGIYLMSW